MVEHLYLKFSPELEKPLPSFLGLPIMQCYSVQKWRGEPLSLHHVNNVNVYLKIDGRKDL